MRGRPWVWPRSPSASRSRSRHLSDSLMLPDVFLTPPSPTAPCTTRRRGGLKTAAPRCAAAVAAGYGIEIDVQPSSDGVWRWVFHDEWLDRLTDETGPINARTAAELGAFRCDTAMRHPDAGRGRRHRGGQGSAADRDQGSGRPDGPCTPRGGGDRPPALQGYAGPVALMSFNPHSVARMGTLTPTCARPDHLGWDYADWAQVTPEVCDPPARHP